MEKITFYTIYTFYYIVVIFGGQKLNLNYYPDTAMGVENCHAAPTY